MALPRVVFPEPLSPIIPNVSPLYISKLTPSIATTFFFANSLFTS